MLRRVSPRTKEIQLTHWSASLGKSTNKSLSTYTLECFTG